MYKEVAYKLATELRSGKYPQGKGRLCADGRYCALGVLCELAIKEGVDIKTATIRYAQTEDWEFVREYDGETSGVPDSVIEWAGMRHWNIFGGIKDLHPNIISPDIAILSDLGRPFDWLADLIEEHYEKI